MSQVSLRWLLQKPYVPSVVIGARTVDQLVDNMGAGSGWELSTDEVILSCFTHKCNMARTFFLRIMWLKVTKLCLSAALDEDIG